jgi:hypothetical protein
MASTNRSGASEFKRGSKPREAEAEKDTRPIHTPAGAKLGHVVQGRKPVGPRLTTEELRARAEAARIKMLSEPHGPDTIPPEVRDTTAVGEVETEAPRPVRTLIAELATAIEALDTDARAEALRDLDKMLTRFAG